MSEDHGIHQTDAASQPSRADVGTGVQDMHGEEDQAELVFGDSESTEEPVGDQGIGKNAPAECIQ